MRCYQKVPGLSQKRNASLIYSILAAISFRIVSLGMYTVILRFRTAMEVIFLNAVQYRLRFPLRGRHCFKTSSLQFHF
jgi:predicted tellurium resistance membrane protein TerC